MKKYFNLSWSIILIVIILSCNRDIKKEIISVPKDTVYFYKSDGLYLSEFEFKSSRRFLNDSVFVDNRILCADDTANVCAFKCYVKNGDWYIWCGSKWALLYSAKNKKLESIETLYDERMIVPKTVYTLNKDTLYSFDYKEKNIVKTTDYTKYMFSPKHGIVILYDVSGFLFRSDFDTSNLLQTIRAKEN